MNNNFINDPNNDLDVMMEGLTNQYFDAIKKHDYSYMFSDDDRWYNSGIKSEKHIKELLHGLIGICRVDAERLLEDSLSEVTEQFVDGLTHRVIKSWFDPYIEDLGPEYDSAGFTDDDRIVSGSYQNLEKLQRGRSKY
jgi:hypothetical protein